MRLSRTSKRACSENRSPSTSSQEVLEFLSPTPTSRDTWSEPSRLSSSRFSPTSELTLVLRRLFTVPWSNTRRSEGRKISSSRSWTESTRSFIETISQSSQLPNSRSVFPRASSLSSLELFTDASAHLFRRSSPEALSLTWPIGGSTRNSFVSLPFSFFPF